MSQYEPEKYLTTIDAVLSVADLEEITVKKIRNALQELFGVDLQPHKKEINEIILERYYDLKDKRENDEKSEKQRRAEVERQDALLAARLLKSEGSGPVMRSRPPKVTKKVSTRTVTNSGFNREMVLSHELLEVVGTSRLSRPQVVKHLWAYIKGNDLQNPKDKRIIICDEALQKLFKKKTVGAFDMNRILSKHIFKPEEVGKKGQVKEEVVEEDPLSEES